MFIYIMYKSVTRPSYPINILFTIDACIAVAVHDFQCMQEKSAVKDACGLN